MQQPFPLQASKLIALVATVFALTAAHSQSITVEPLAATVPAAIPVDHPGALALLALAICVCIAWAVRTGHLSLGPLRSWAAGGALVVAAGMALWGTRCRQSCKSCSAISPSLPGRRWMCRSSPLR